MCQLRAFVLLIGFSISCGSLLHAERQIAEIAQPLSLLGTDADDDPLGDGESLAATIASRPTVVGGAFPECVVAAMALPHHVAGAPEGFPEESNLIILVGAVLTAEWGEEFHTVTADFSSAKVPDELGLSLLQVMQLTARCLQENLRSEANERPIKIVWKVPTGMTIPVDALPATVK